MVHGGSSLAEWFLGLQGQGLGGSVDGYFTTLVGRILNSEREVSGLGLDGLQEVVFNGRLRGGAVRGGGLGVVVGAEGVGLMRELLVRGRVGVGVSSDRVVWGLLLEGYVFSAQLVVIRRMCRKVSPRSGRVVVLRVGEEGGGSRAVVGKVRFEEGVQGGGVDSDGQGGVEEPLPPGLVLSQRDQALGALKALVQVLGLEKGSQVMGLVEGLLPQKPASLVPATPTHAEMVARLHELYASEKKVSKKVEEAKGRLEKARALSFGGGSGAVHAYFCCAE